MALKERQNLEESSQTTRKRPLYRSVSDAIRQRLVEGQLAAGARLPALRELASEFSVSTITVRQALQTLEREGRLHCIPGVGVFVRPSIPGRQAVESTVLAFATIDLDATLSGQIAHGIEEACQERGWAMQLLNARSDPHLEARNLSRLAKSGVSGAVILAHSDAENLEAMVQLKLSGFPFVLVDFAVPGLKVDVVSSDHEKGAYLATEHLIKLGHRHILMVTEMPNLSSRVARIAGYERALVRHGIQPLWEWKLWIDEATVVRGCLSGRSWLGGCEAVLPALKRFEPPIAIFAHNAYSGWGVFEACRQAGRRIPQDVSVICFDDAEFTRALNPPLTAVAQRTNEIGRRAVEMLDRRLSTGTMDNPQQVAVDVDLVERGSVAAIDGCCPAAQSDGLGESDSQADPTRL